MVIMMDHVDAVEEEIVEGMEHSDEGHGHVHVHEDGEEDGHLEEDEEVSMRSSTTSISGPPRSMP